MGILKTASLLLLAAAVTLGAAESAYALGGKKKGGKMMAGGRDRAAEDFPHIDANGDGNLSRSEWNRRGNFDRLDTDGDGLLSLDELRAMYKGHDNRSYAWPVAWPVAPSKKMDSGIAAAQVGRDALDRETLCAIGRSRKCDAEPSKRRGLFETGLGPVFPANADCPGIDDYFALDYGFKRTREAYHGGIDMPVPWGTPMLAAAAGTVVGVFRGEESARGMEVVLRHSPEDTGLPLWIYTQYGHMDALPDLKVGQRVNMGQVLAPTGNSGVSGKDRAQQTSLRRPAIHFAAFYSDSEQYAVVRDTVIPVDGHWMDPVGLFRQTPPFDSAALKALPVPEKGVPIPVMLADGATLPAATKLVWPYACVRR